MKSFESIQRWLQSEPTLTELRSRYPQVWDRSRLDMLDAHARNKVPELIAALSEAPSLDHQVPHRVRIEQLVRAQMILRTLRAVGLSTEAGVEGMFSLGSGDARVLQRIFFASGLVRKPASVAWYLALWPLLRTRRRLMPLVRQHGIYCFYSRQLVSGIARLAKNRPVLEIAAGDGTLTRFLQDAGVQCEATDDFSWQGAIHYPSSVRRLDARAALNQQPAVVLCSWPPPGNEFERHVFLTSSVQTYIVIASANRADSGDWEAYARQGRFRVVEDVKLSAAVLPRGQSKVLVFERA